MTAINWAMLAKSMLDPETIEEAIDRKITEHNANEEAHLAVGQSLQSHKVAEIIDHLAYSIIADKLKDGEISLEKLTAKKRILMTCFETIDGWSSFGSHIQDIGSVMIRTTALSDSYGGLYMVPSTWSGLTWTKNLIAQTTLKLSHITTINAWFGVGATDYIGSYSSAGFLIENDKLYCYHAEESGGALVYTTHEITGYTLTNWNTYRIKYDNDTGELHFYINGELVKTFSSGLPTATDDTGLFYQVQTKTTEIRRIDVSDAFYSLEK